MCEKPEPPENQSITEGENTESISFSELYDTITEKLEGDGDKPSPPDNQSTTRGDNGGGDKPSAPPNQEITKGGN